MSALRITEIAAVAGVIFALAALALLLLNYRTMKRMNKNQRVILGPRGETDIVAHVGGLEDKLGNLRTAIEDLALLVQDHDSRIDACVSRLGMVRFDAYDDLGGRQSTSLAFLDAKEDGVVLSSVVSRDFARIYVKSIRDGQPDVPLAPEEVEAFDQARAKAPFTVRPRPEPKRTDKLEASPETVSNEDIKAAMRELQRENRRRVRRGMPPLDELPATPSGLGWPEPAPRVSEEELENELIVEEGSEEAVTL